MSFLLVHSIDKVTLEFTTRCNLKCTYCAVTRPWHRKRDLDLTQFDNLVTEMKQLRVRRVQISGGGETTIVKDWDQYLQKLLDHDFEVSIISNMAKPLSEQAVHALSLCVEVQMSSDTANPELYQEIRRGADFETFCSNIRRVRAHAEEQGRKPPYMVWNAVANDKIVAFVDQWVEKGIELGIDHFQLSELMKYEDLPGFISVNPVGTMSDEDLAVARASVERARQLAKAAGKWFAVVTPVEEALNGSRRFLRMVTNIEQAPDGKPVFKDGRISVQVRDQDGVWNEVADSHQPAPLMPGKMTKNCLMPWTEAFLWANNELAPCCLYKGVAEYSGTGLKDALNSAALVEIRQGLLTGNLTHVCHLCPMYDQIEVGEFHKRLQERIVPA